MVKKVVKYAAMDGKEFPTHTEAYEYEKSLQRVLDVQALILDVVATTLDDKGRQVFFNIPAPQALTLADLITTTDLYDRLKVILK